MSPVPVSSIAGRRLVAELDKIIERRGKPPPIVSDNCGAMTRRAVLQWTMETGIEYRCIVPSKPTQNAFIESFNSRLRDACFNECQFGSRVDAIEKVEAWRIDGNTARPHSSISNQTRAAFASASIFAMQWSETLRYPRGFAPRPVATTTRIGSNPKRTLPSNG